MSKENVIKMVNESSGSLFTKEDVINLINLIDEKQNQINYYDLIERLKDAVDEVDDDLIEVDANDCTFDIERGNEIRVSDVCFNSDNYKKQIKEEIISIIYELEEGKICQVESVEAGNED